MFGELTPNGFSGCNVCAFQASFCTTFLIICGRCESLWTATYPRTVVGGTQGHAASKILLLHKVSLCQSNFIEIIRLSPNRGESSHPQFWGYCRIVNRGVCLFIGCVGSL